MRSLPYPTALDSPLHHLPSLLVHTPLVFKDGTASIDRVLSFVSGGVGRAGARRDTRERFDQEPAGGGHYSDDGMDDDALGEARRKLRSALKLGTAKEMSPRRLFEYLDPDGRGEVRVFL